MADKLSASIKTLVKVALQAKYCPIVRNGADAPRGDRPLYIMGNGPSLRTNLDNNLELLERSDTLAVNFAANTPEFRIVRPKYYVLADPHFFRNISDKNVAALLESLKAVDWRMTLFVPAKSRRSAARMIGNTMVSVEGFNFLAAEGWTWLEQLMFRLRLGMPRPRNVLIPSIMIGVWLGYKKIYILGADHSWLKTLDVDSDNRVVSVQPHFYKEDSHEVERINRTYLDLKLHQVLESMTIAFASYHKINAYASRCGITIINATPGSFIDAFPRGSIE